MLDGSWCSTPLRVWRKFVAGVGWHRAAAWDAGYAESWLVWHRGDHALLAARDT